MEGAVLPGGGEQDTSSPRGCSRVRPGHAAATSRTPFVPTAPVPGGKAGMWAGSSGAEAAGGQAQPGLFYSRLFPAKKTESDTSTPRRTSCRYPARGCWSPGPVRRHRLRSWGSGRKGMAPLMGGRTAGCWGRATSCGGEEQTRYPPHTPKRPPSSILPTHQPPKLFCFQPGEESREQVLKPGRRDSSLPALHPARSRSLQPHRCAGPAPAPPRPGPELPRPQHSR